MGVLNMARKKSNTYDYDIVIIGSGAGGSVAAHIANRAGKSVAIIEAGMIGGECPNVGCVPTKALLHAAEIYDQAKHAERFGIRGKIVSYNYPSIKAWKDLAVKRTGTYLGEEMFKKEGIAVFTKPAHFLDPHTVSVGERRITGRQFLIAVGAKTFVPPIPGLKEVGYLTHEKAVDLLRPPRHLAIIGGGAIGCEFAQLFAIFGSNVHIIDVAPRLLSREDPEVGDAVAERLSKQYGVTLHLSATIAAAESVSTKKRLTIKTASGKNIHVLADEIMLATGKKGVADLGLENAGVAYSSSGIATNRQMQTSAQHIFAAGDCVGPYQFTHVATYQSRVAVHNMLHPKNPQRADYRAVPRCIFTSPEVAAVGPTEQELKDKSVPYVVAISPLQVIGRANTTDTNGGFVKVIAHKKTGVLISASIVSPHAGEMIHELTLAIQSRLQAKDVAHTIHAFPTWSEAVRVACAKLVK
jgi:pyruvate/2-oxoglutarate dehydrogenase complex dihydrolipoamide dehydrogenase (E3) component